MNSRISIVAIGASAGGVEALRTFFQAMPSDTETAFVVLTHLDSARKSRLVEILAACTTMPVRQAQDGMEVEARHVYVLPENAELTIKNRRLCLREPRGNERLPIEKAVATRARVVENGITVDIGSEVKAVNLVIEPVAEGPAIVCLVLCAEGAPVPIQGEAPGGSVMADNATMAALEFPEELHTVSAELSKKVEELKILVDELNHRVKNTLAVVVSIANRTAARSSGMAVFLDKFLGRVRALAKAHDLLAQSNWIDAGLCDIIQAQLAPFIDSGDSRISIEGPAVFLTPRSALALGMAFHELATNAAKYGALSVPEGRVEVRWVVVASGAARSLDLSWSERNGPPVRRPAKRGYGLEQVAEGLPYAVEGEVKVQFKPGGVRCLIIAPLDAEGRA